MTPIYKWSGEYFGLTLEWARHDETVGNPESFYIQPYVRLLDKKLVVFIDADYLKNPLGQTTLGSSAVNDPYIKWEYTAGVNYHFLPNAKLRLDFIFHDYTGVTAVVARQNRDYYSVSFSSGFSF